jgi:hypothetical protein
MDAHDLVTVYTLTDPVEAEVVRNALHAEGIRCFLAGIHQADLGLRAFEIEVQVPAADGDRARRIIQSHEARSPASRPHRRGG